MRKFNRPGPDDRDQNEINLTPMLDVVFIMLIFFIVTATFLRESGLPAYRSNEAREEVPESEAILITIDAGDEIRVDGQLVDARAVRAHLERLHAANPEWPLIIEPKGGSTARMLVAAIDAARLTEIDDVTIAGGN